MIAPWKNPEWIRNCRAQLRIGRAVTAAGICAVLSVAVGFALSHSNDPAQRAPRVWGMLFLQTALVTQVVVLLIGGGIACLHAVQREKDQNTFDFQRVTRLTPLDLALGKLFGAPTLAYFVALCLIPAAVYGAIIARVSLPNILAAYLVIVLGSVAGHALALLISVFIPKNASTGAVILFLLVIGMTARSDALTFSLHNVSPFAAASIVEQMGAPPQTMMMFNGRELTFPDPLRDVFFGYSVNHVVVLGVLYVTFGAWFLLGVTRNIKRDPAVYSLYSPVQSLGVIFYINVIWLGFFRQLTPAYLNQHFPYWQYESESTLLGLNTAVFVAMGLALLRNRDQVRRRLRELGPRVSEWMESFWPAPYLIAGVAVVGMAVIWFVNRMRVSGSNWSASIGALRVVFLGVWLVRDLVFLQWMNLRRGKRPLMLGVLYLAVFYTCSLTVFGFLGYFGWKPGHLALTAFFLPSAVFGLNGSEWAATPQVWIVALAAQAVVAGVFVYLGRERLKELAGPRIT